MMAERNTAANVYHTAFQRFIQCFSVSKSCRKLHHESYQRQHTNMVAETEFQELDQ